MRKVKITAAVLAALCAVPVIAAAESAEDMFTEGGIEYIIDADGNARVVNIADKELIDVVIPEEIRGHKVTALGNENGAMILNRCKQIQSVTIPVSITSIGNSCFFNIESLTDVYYAGTSEQWRKISVGMNNHALNNVKFHFDAGDPDIEDIPDLDVAGDADCDGAITTRDATAVLKHIMQIELLEGDGYVNADANGDGIVNTKDATLILKTVLGLL